MLWLFLSLLTALASASQDAWTKKFFSHLNTYEMLAYPLLYSLPFFVAALILIPVPVLDSVYYWCWGFSLPLNAICSLLYIRAIKISPLSLTLPYMAFTPVFMIGTGMVVLGESPNAWGIGGILTTCLGGYILNIEPEQKSMVAPFKALVRETGSWIMLIVAFLYSIAAVIGKKGMLHSSPMFFTMSFFVAMNILLICGLIAFRKVGLKTLSRDPLKGGLVGIFMFLHALLHTYAIMMVKAVYMIAVKRTSVLFGVGYGYLLFREERIFIRLSGALCMLGGALIIMFKG